MPEGKHSKTIKEEKQQIYYQFRSLFYVKDKQVLCAAPKHLLRSLPSNKSKEQQFTALCSMVINKTQHVIKMDIIACGIDQVNNAWERLGLKKKGKKKKKTKGLQSDSSGSWLF